MRMRGKLCDVSGEGNTLDTFPWLYSQNSLYKLWVTGDSGWNNTTIKLQRGRCTQGTGGGRGV